MYAMYAQTGVTRSLDLISRSITYPQGDILPIIYIMSSNVNLDVGRTFPDGSRTHRIRMAELQFHNASSSGSD